MTRVDLFWNDGIKLREQVWSWRHDVSVQIVNPDIDGLLTACLLHHLKGWPVVGLYDTQRLLIDATVSLPLDLRRVAWVDIDMCWPGARSLSQHVVQDRPTDVSDVEAYRETVNPSLLRGHARRLNYRAKYPFGTFQWAWWLSGLTPLPDVSDSVLTGLAWMPDGGFQSVRDQWRSNCLQWAIDQMPGSILSPLAATEPDKAWDAVRIAETELIRRSGVRDGWHNHQFNMTRPSSRGPQLNFAFDEIPDVIQSICDAICSVYGWKTPRIPTNLALLEGVWRAGSKPPLGWPGAANRLEVTSLAVTGAGRFCWTEPAELAVALGA